MLTDSMQSLDVDAIKTALSQIDPASLVPKISDITAIALLICRCAVMLVPLVLLVLGLLYLLFAPKEANYYFGYRTTFGMGSVSAWRHTQRVAGAMFTLLGLALTAGMYFYTISMGNMAPMDMVWTAVGCVVLEGVLVLLARFLVNTVAMSTFNFRGERRGKRKTVK